LAGAAERTLGDILKRSVNQDDYVWRFDSILATVARGDPMSAQSKSNHEKALVAKYWTAAILTDLGFKVGISSKASRLAVTRDERTLTVRPKACYDERGVPFNGFEIDDSDFVILVELRRGALQARAWVVPTQIVYTWMEQAYAALGSSHLSQRTFYWEDGSKPHYGFERKLEPYLNAWNSLYQARKTAA
jgi:hypothetical protein